MVELYKRNIWNDEKTCQIIAEGVFNRNYKIVYMACSFLIDSCSIKFKTDENLSDEENNDSIVREAIGSKKTKKKVRQLKREIKTAKRKK